jgi:hypothetical protein
MRRLLAFAGSILLSIAPVGLKPPQEGVIPGTGLHGTILDYAGAPLAGAKIAYSATGTGWSAPITTQADGTYSAAVPAGSFKVRITAPGGLVQYAPGQTTVDAATAYVITNGSMTTVDDQLLPSGTVQINLVSSAGGAPVGVGCVALAPAASQCGQADGHYLYAGVPLGDHTLSVFDIKTFFPRTVTIPVTAGAGTFPVALDPAATIQTTVTASDNPAVHPNFCVLAVYPGVDEGTNVNCGVDPSTGSLLIGPVKATNVQLFALPADVYDSSHTFAPAYGAQWVGVSGGTGDQRLARKIKTVAGAVSTIPAIHVDPAGSIAGLLDDAYIGDSQTRAWIRPFGLQDGLRFIGAPIDQPALVGYDYIGAPYVLNGLGPYAWPINVQGDRGVYADYWSGGATNRYNATAVQVHSNQTTTLNVILRLTMAGVTGDIHITSGASAGPFWVSARNVYTGDSTGLSRTNGAQFGIGGLNSDSVVISYGIIGGTGCTSRQPTPTGGAGSTNVVLVMPTPSSCPASATRIVVRTQPPPQSPTPRRRVM